MKISRPTAPAAAADAQKVGGRGGGVGADGGGVRGLAGRGGSTSMLRFYGLPNLCMFCWGLTSIGGRGNGRGRDGDDGDGVLPDGQTSPQRMTSPSMTWKSSPRSRPPTRSPVRAAASVPKSLECGWQNIEHLFVCGH